jgi:hypothetical protein
MRLAGLRSLLVTLAVLMAGAGAGCDNPFDPLNTSDKIQGLTYFDFSARQEHWDSDPEWDGLQVELLYKNELGTQLNFHDKPHKVEIEFWSQKDDGETPPILMRDGLLASKTVEFVNSDDLINIPIEFYGGSLSLPSSEAIKGCLLVRVFPPQKDPQEELVLLQCDIEFFTPETAIL